MQSTLTGLHSLTGPPGPAGPPGPKGPTGLVDYGIIDQRIGQIIKFLKPASTENTPPERDLAHQGSQNTKTGENVPSNIEVDLKRYQVWMNESYEDNAKRLRDIESKIQSLNTFSGSNQNTLQPTSANLTTIHSNMSQQFEDVNNKLERYDRMLSEAQADNIRQSTEIARLTSAMTAMKSNLDQLSTQISSSSRTVPVPSDTAPHWQSFCLLEYENKCYKVIMSSSSNTPLSTAVAECTKIGSTPANIYTQELYDLLLVHIRKTSPISSINLWLGMTYDHENKYLRFSGGARSYFVKWYQGYPTATSSYKNVYWNINKSTTANQGMVNYPLSSRMHGVICQV